MDTSLKQKIMIFAVMSLVFLASVFLRQYLDTGRFLPIGDTGGVVRADAFGELIEKEQNEDGSGSATSEESAEAEIPAEIIVDVEGAVVSPGVVRLPEGSRVFEAVEAAGGTVETADYGRVNLAEKITDGAAIYIPFRGEEQTDRTPGMSSVGSAVSTASGDSGGLININTADKAALMQLPGIGEVYAQSIIDYRQSVGAFQRIEDIKNVYGIGDGKFEKLKDLITV